MVRARRSAAGVCQRAETDHQGADSYPITRVHVASASCLLVWAPNGHAHQRDPALFQSGRRDLNSGPLVPQTSALTRLRHAPRRHSPPDR